MTRDRWLWVLAVLVLVAGGWWISDKTEWVEKDAPRSVRGEARDNPVYAFEQILRRLGMRAEHFEQLDRMPPEGARLVLLSSNWSMVPERATQMRNWVERGGHLVLLQSEDWDETRLESWVPIFAYDVSEKIKRQQKEAAAAAAASASAAEAGAHRPDHQSHHKPDHGRKRDGDEGKDGEGGNGGKGGNGDDDDEDEDRDEAFSNPPLFGDIASLDVCERFYSSKRLRPKAGHEAAWTLTQAHGAQAVRVAQGRGSVTVLASDPRLFMNRVPFGCDVSLLLAATVQAEPGATVWIYLNEKRESLTPWLWRTGWIAIVLGVLALAAALWRAAVRFGPRVAAPPRLRRSISEQVRGMGAYLLRSALFGTNVYSVYFSGVRRIVTTPSGPATIDRASAA